MSDPHVHSGPTGDLLTGNLRALLRDPPAFLERCARDYGDVVPLRFGPKRALFLNDPAAIEAVLVAKSELFAKPYIVRTDRVRIGNGQVGAEGDVWRRQRLTQPAFLRRRLTDYGDSMVAATARMLTTWHDGDTFDVVPAMMRLTLEIVAETLLGADVTDDADEVGTALTVVMDTFMTRLRTLFLVPELLPTPGNVRLRRAQRQLDAVMDRMIATRRASRCDATDLLGLLLQAQAASGGAMTDQQIRDQAMAFFLAGHETVALALSWTWYLLAQHPAVEATLLDELQTVLGDRVPTPADQPRLVYTEMVALEALRLYPPVWVMARVALQTCALGGHQVPAGTMVLMSQWVTHRDPRFFDQPALFHPDRWRDGFTQWLPRYAYFPFGGGPRGCIGRGFAMMEAVLLLATIAQRFQLTTEPGHPVVPRASITLRPAHGIRVVLHQRHHDSIGPIESRTNRTAGHRRCS